MSGMVWHLLCIMKKLQIFLLFIVLQQGLLAANICGFDSLTGSQNHLKILSWNIGMLPGLDLFKDKDDRPQAIAKALRDKDYDIIVFQEAFTMYSRNIIGRSLHDQYPYVYGPLNKNIFSLKINGGVWILSRIPLKIRKEIEFTVAAGMDELARKGAVLLEGLFYGAPFQLIATHLQDDEYPQAIRDEQLAEIHEKLIIPYSETDTPQIICGDFNTDEKMAANYREMLAILDAEDKGISGTMKVTFDDESNDAWKSLNPDPRRIDYVFTRNAHLLRDITEKVAVLKSQWGENKEYLSDHNGLEADIEFQRNDFLTRVFK